MLQHLGYKTWRWNLVFAPTTHRVPYLQTVIALTTTSGRSNA